MNGADTAINPNPASFVEAFPDFPAADMPAIPAGFVDCSWRNDAMPSFYDDARQLCLWIDYADVNLREFGEGPRFSVMRETRLPDGAIADHTGDGLVFESSDWPAVEAFLSTYPAA